MLKKSDGSSSNFDTRYIVSPKKFGSGTVEPLLHKGILSPSESKRSDVSFRGWSLEDYWEHISWPRDSVDGVTRFGLPVVEDLEFLNQELADEEMIKAAQARSEESESPPSSTHEEENGKNPFVHDIHGFEGLQKDILFPGKDCILFLTAPFCKTCKSLSPQYTRIARQGKKKYEDHVTFAKADATGKVGKTLCRALDVDTVPAFVLFRNGKIYGERINVSKLPSKHIDLALQRMASGMEWDKTLLKT